MIYNLSSYEVIEMNIINKLSISQFNEVQLEELTLIKDLYKSFERGLIEAGHEILVSDLYDMNFKTDMSEEEYLRLLYKYQEYVERNL